MSKFLGEKTKLIAGIAPVAFAAGNSNGIVIDRMGFYDAIVHLKVGAAAGAPTAQGVSLKIQTGDAPDGSDMSDVTGATIAALTANNAEARLNLDLNGFKRYFRVVPTVAFTGGSSPTIPVAVTLALGNANSLPV